MRTRVVLLVALVMMAGCGGGRLRAIDLRLATEPETSALGQALATGYESRKRGSSITLGGPSEAALLLLPDEGVEQAVTVPVGLEALVVLAHPNNPIRDITETELLRLLRGDEATWEALGGPAVDVVSVQQAAETTTRRALESRAGVQLASDTRLVGSVGQAVEAVARTEGAFTVAPLGAVPTFEGVRLLRVNGYAPTEEHILNRQYPYVFPIVYAAPAEPKEDSLAFLEWLLSAEGQRALSGYVTPIQGP
jgi:ABC-type phosphate transport system substrate-binding protein